MGGHSRARYLLDITGANIMSMMNAVTRRVVDWWKTRQGYESGMAKIRDLMEVVYRDVDTTTPGLSGRIYDSVPLPLTTTTTAVSGSVDWLDPIHWIVKQQPKYDEKEAEKLAIVHKIPKEDIVSTEPLELDPKKYHKVVKPLTSAPQCGTEGTLMEVQEELGKYNESMIGMEVHGLQHVQVRGWVKLDERDTKDIERFGDVKKASYARMMKNCVKQIMKKCPEILQEAMEEGANDIQPLMGGYTDEGVVQAEHWRRQSGLNVRKKAK